MRIRRLVTLLLSACVLSLPTAHSAPAQTGQSLLEQASTPVDSSADHTAGAIKWSHGAFVYEREPALNGGLPPAFFTLDRNGALLSSVQPQIPDAAHFVVTSFDRAADGSISFSGIAYSYAEQSSPFIARISSDGQSSRIIKTAPYWPFMLSVAPDGTIWTIGREMINYDAKAPGLDPKAGVVRHFDNSGTLIGSAGPQSQFGLARTDHGYLIATSDRVGWYAPTQGHGTYVELSPSTLSPTVYPALSGLNPHQRVEGLSLTDAGEVFICISDSTPSEEQGPGFHLRALYKLDRSTSKWIPVQMPKVHEAAHMIGSDGERLVLAVDQTARFFSLVP